MEAGKKSGSKTMTRIGGRQAITRDMAEATQKAIADLRWELISDKAVKAIKDGNIPPEIMERITKVISAHDKTTSDAVKVEKLLEGGRYARFSG